MHPHPRAWQPPLQTSAGSLRASEPSRAHSTRATLGNPPPSTRPDKQPLRHPERPKPFSESGKAGMEALRGKRGSKVQKPLRKQGPRRQWGYRRKPSDNRPFPVSKSRAKWRPPRRSPASPPETELLPNSGRPPTRGGPQLASALPARGKRGRRNPPREQLRLPGLRTRPSLCFPLVLSPAPSASSEEGWEPRARATTLPSVSSSTSSQTGPESVAAQAQAPRAEAVVVAAAGQCKMAAALVAAVDGAAGPGTVGAAAGRRMTQDGKRAAEPRRLPCL